MGLEITGKKMDVGQALRTQTEQKLHHLCTKYDLTPLKTVVTFSTEGSPYHHMIRCDIDMHVGRDLYVRAHKETDDAHVSLEQALETVETQLRRHKEKVIDANKKQDVDFSTVVLGSFEDEDKGRR